MQPKLARRISEAEIKRLKRLVVNPRLQPRLVPRLRSILLWNRGVDTSGIALQIGVSPGTVIRWRSRFLDGGVEGLVGLKLSIRSNARLRAPRRSRKAQQILAFSLVPPPQNRNRWAAREIAQIFGVSAPYVRRIWSHNALAMRRIRWLTVSTVRSEVSNFDRIEGVFIDRRVRALIICRSKSRRREPLQTQAACHTLADGHGSNSAALVNGNIVSRLYSVISGIIQNNYALSPRRIAPLRQILKDENMLTDRDLRYDVIIDTNYLLRQIYFRQWMLVRPDVYVYCVVKNHDWGKVILRVIESIDADRCGREMAQSMRLLLRAAEANRDKRKNDRVGFLWFYSGAHQ